MSTASIKDYNIKIRSLKSTQKITKTMKMVSASKLRKAQQAQAHAKLYAQNVSALTSRISSAVQSTVHPLLMSRPDVKNILILAITSDKGLCGAFNHNVNKRVASWIEENRNHRKVEISCCGKRGYMFFKKYDIVKNYYKNATENPKFSSAKEIGEDLSKSFINAEYDEVYISCNQFFNPLVQKTVFERILPIDSFALLGEKAEPTTQYLFDPEVKKLLGLLIPRYLYFKIYFALLENAAGEHGARMTAMDSATKNASELIDHYTLFRNRARQASITTELSEIVAGAEAQK